MYLPDMDFGVNEKCSPCQPRKSTLPPKCKKLRHPVKILEAAFDNFIFFEHAVAGSDLGWHEEHFSLTPKSMSGKYIDKSPFSVLKRIFFIFSPCQPGKKLFIFSEKLFFLLLIDLIPHTMKAIFVIMMILLVAGNDSGNLRGQLDALGVAHRERERATYVHFPVAAFLKQVTEISSKRMRSAAKEGKRELAIFLHDNIFVGGDYPKEDSPFYAWRRCVCSKEFPNIGRKCENRRLDGIMAFRSHWDSLKTNVTLMEQTSFPIYRFVFCWDTDPNWHCPLGNRWADTMNPELTNEQLCKTSFSSNDDVWRTNQWGGNWIPVSEHVIKLPPP